MWEVATTSSLQFRCFGYSGVNLNLKQEECRGCKFVEYPQHRCPQSRLLVMLYGFRNSYEDFAEDSVCLCSATSAWHKMSRSWRVSSRKIYSRLLLWHLLLSAIIHISPMKGNNRDHLYAFFVVELVYILSNRTWGWRTSTRWVSVCSGNDEKFHLYFLIWAKISRIVEFGIANSCGVVIILFFRSSLHFAVRVG